MSRIPDVDLLRAHDQIAAQRDEIVQLLRDHVTDWGPCDHPHDCDCSDARARRYLAVLLNDAAYWLGYADEPKEPTDGL